MANGILDLPECVVHVPVEIDYGRRCRFVSAATNGYVPGLTTLIQSMKENSGLDFSFVVLEYAPIDVGRKKEIDALGVPVEYLDVQKMLKVHKPQTKCARMAPNFYKTLIWTLPYDETLVYVDADMLCLNSLQGMHDFPMLSVVRKQSGIGKLPGHDPRYAPSKIANWNAGMMVFKPSMEIFEAVQQQARSYKAPIAFGDQVIHNDYFNRNQPELVNYVTMDWNMSTWVYYKHPHIFNAEPVRLLHFAHDQKPWSHLPPQPWMARFWHLWRAYNSRARKAARNSRSKA